MTNSQTMVLTPQSAADGANEVRLAVPDNFDYHIAHKAELPTTDKVGTIPHDVDALHIATAWLRSFAQAVSTGQNVGACFLQDGIWRDKAIVTGDYRTITGRSAIDKMAKAMMPQVKMKNIHIIDPGACVQHPWEDLQYLQAHFYFDTTVANGSAVVNLIRTLDGDYLAWTLHTVLEALNDFPDIPRADGHMIGPVSWTHQRDIDTSFELDDPDVIIVGAGHNGLALAARLQALGVKTLIIERNARVGDNWRNRYESLSLHFPYWADHLPYMPYPEKWPLYCPAQKLGNWLESYADALDLRVWTASNVVEAKQDPITNVWTLKIERNGQGERVLKPKHVVMCTSLAGVPSMPTIPGMEQFLGVIRHSTAHDSSKHWVGKKVLVVGTSSSGFDTAFDFSRRGVDVTMLQRSPTYIMSLTHSVPMFLGGLYDPAKNIPLEVADRLNWSMPTAPGEILARRSTQKLQQLDADLLNGMERAGFKCWAGQKGTGVTTLGMTKNGGFYFDAGACEHVIDGRIKVEQGYIEKFDEDSLTLSGGRKRQYDLVVMATGFSNTIDSIRRTLGSDISERCGPIWGVDEDGEMRGAWRQFGVENLWVVVGTLQMARFHSKIVATRIKAALEGVNLEVYQG